MNKKRSDISFTSRLYVMLCIYIYIHMSHVHLPTLVNNVVFQERFLLTQVKCLVSGTEDLR